MEYIIVKYGRVIWGPRPWNPFAIELAIEQETQQNLTLGPNPITGQVAEGISILQVLSVNKPPHDPIFETLAGPEWHHNVPEKTTTASYTVVEQHIPYIAGNLRTQLAHKRWEKENAGVIVSIKGANIKFSTDRQSRETLMLQSMVSKADIVWKIDNSTSISLTVTDQQVVIDAINQHVQQLFAWESDISSRIESATTTEQLKTIYTELTEQ